MKKKAKRLTLDRETLRQLTDKEERAIVAGATTGGEITQLNGCPSDCNEVCFQSLGC